MKRTKFKAKKIISVVFSVAAALILAAVAVFYAVTSPEITLNGSEEERIYTGTEYKDAGATAHFGILDISKRLVCSCSVDTSAPNDGSVEYSVSFLGKTAEKTRTVHVLDNVPPVITLVGDGDITVERLEDFTDGGSTAVDNCDGDITSKITVTTSSEEKTDSDGIKMTVYTYTYSVADSSGNVSSVTRTVTAKDTTPPEIRLNGASEVIVLRGKEYREQGASATDNITEKPEVKISGSVDTSRAGVYRVTYTAFDESGNSASVSRSVRVREPLPASHGDAEPGTPGTVCLTFDDGPNWGTTDRILDILREYNVKATFFVIDYSADKIPLLKRIVNEGHTLAIHSRSHTYSECYKNADSYMNGVYYMQEKIYADTGYTATVIRFPGGTSNTVSKKYCPGVMTELASRATEAGFNYVDWNVDSTDASGTCRPAATLVKNTLGGLRKDRVNVVLMHDASAKRTTPDALPEIISRAADSGYKFARVSESTRCRHAANN